MTSISSDRGRGLRTGARAAPGRAARLGSALAIAALAVLAGVPLVANDYWLNAILIPFLIMSLAGLGLNLLMGYAGQASLGTGGFMSVGAYATYNLLLRLPRTSAARQPAARRRHRRSRRAGRRPAQPSHQGILSRRLDSCDAVLSRVALQSISAGSRTIRRRARFPRRVLPSLVTTCLAPSAAIF